MPTRGARLCTLKEMAVQLAGFADDRDDAVADGGRATRRCAARLAEQYGITVAGFDPNTPIGRKAERPRPGAGASRRASQRPQAGRRRPPGARRRRPSSEYSLAGGRWRS